MAWVRYDDSFPKHRKTLEVKARCREALTLHVLCNTWTASTDRPGHVPLAAVIEEGGGKAKGLRWARVLVEAGMWHAAGHDCERCPQPEQDGYVVHDFEDYNPLSEVSRKRSAAGKKGAAARWGTGGKPPPDNSKSHSNGMANAIGKPPESHDSRIATDGIARGHPLPQPPSTQLGTYVATVDAHENANGSPPEHSPVGALVAHYAAGVPLTDHARASRTIADALDRGITPDLIRTGLDRLVAEQRSCTPDQLRIAILATPGNWRPQSKPSTSDLRVAEALDLAAQLRAEETGQPTLRALPGGAA